MRNLAIRLLQCEHWTTCRLRRANGNDTNAKHFIRFLFEMYHLCYPRTWHRHHCSAQRSLQRYKHLQKASNMALYLRVRLTELDSVMSVKSANMIVIRGKHFFIRIFSASNDEWHWAPIMEMKGYARLWQA